MGRSWEKRFSIFTVLKGIFLFGVVLSVLIPFMHVISVSLSDKFSVIKNEVTIFPKGISLDMYKYVLKDRRILLGYLNTFIYIIGGVTSSLLVTAAGAYAASRQAMIFRKTFIKLVIFCLFFYGGMIPTFLTVRAVGIYNTRWAVVLPDLVSMWLFIIMLSFFRSLPVELEDSAKMEGLADIGIFWYIALPLSKASLATIGLYYGVKIWNEFLNPILFLNNDKKYPLTVLLYNLVIAGSGMMRDYQSSERDILPQNALKYTVLIVSALPIMCVYPFLQRYFIKGTMLGSLKG
jgi:putative aldouronate transport system permease protein